MASIVFDNFYKKMRETRPMRDIRDPEAIGDFILGRGNRDISPNEQADKLDEIIMKNYGENMEDFRKRVDEYRSKNGS